MARGPRNYAAEYAARVTRAAERGQSLSVARGHAKPSELSLTVQKIIARTGATEAQAKTLAAMRSAVNRMKRSYTTATDAYKNGRVPPEAAIGRMNFILGQYTDTPDLITGDTLDLFRQAADMGATMRGPLDPDHVRYTPERKRGEADPGYTLWADELGNEPEDAPAYGTYDEMGGGD